MTISLYQKFLDEISGSLNEKVGIYNSSGVISACTDKELIGSKMSKVDFNYNSYEIEFDKTDKLVMFTEAETDKKTAGIFLASLKASLCDIPWFRRILYHVQSKPPPSGMAFIAAADKIKNTRAMMAQAT